MIMPFFRPEEDPGPNFMSLAHRMLGEPQPTAHTAAPHAGIEITHGTTCVAVHTSAGVVLAGDRRATSGHLIAHRTMQKVFPADRYSGVAIAGAAGPAVEMVKLFQLQLEHYEKVEGHTLSLEGKANQLAQMVRGHLPAAMAGMAVVPIFAGWDHKRQTGRLFDFDVTGGRYEETDHVATGSGSLHAGTVVKLGWRSDLTIAEGIDLALWALWEAADEDSATGGPDLIRKIFPIIATITEDGFQQVEQDDLAERTRHLVDRLELTRSGGGAT